MIGSMKFEFLDLGHNIFFGQFPEFITRFLSLKQLDLSNNLFFASIPEILNALNLEKLNLSYNNFSGMLPPSVGKSKFGVGDFEGNNPGLSASPLRSCRGSSDSKGTKKSNLRKMRYSQ
ncbi:hypothetical protein U1Q18_014262 [Sarracenia purpurea var. burkii]